jgi:hypothetical protein
MQSESSQGFTRGRINKKSEGYFDFVLVSWIMVMMGAGVPGPRGVEALGAVGGLIGHDANCLAWLDQVK